MPITRRQRTSQLAGDTEGSLTFGIVWGGFAGAILGGGVSLTIDLFYSSAVMMILGVISIAAILGGIVGQVMASLLADEASIAGATIATHANSPYEGDSRDINEYRELKTQINDKKQYISEKSLLLYEEARKSADSHGLPLHKYQPDAVIFELIVDRSHQAGLRQGS